MQTSIHLPVTQNVWSKTSSKLLLSYMGSSPETAEQGIERDHLHKNLLWIVTLISPINFVIENFNKKWPSYS